MTDVPTDASYSDGVVTIRRADPELDLEGFLSGTDAAQIDWLWDPGEHEDWEALSADAQREHQRAYLASIRESFGPGPKWCFIGMTKVGYAVYVDCDLNNPDVPAGEANISYTCHPQFRGLGYTSRAVRLALRFLTENNLTTRAHIIVQPANEPSLRVARAVGGVAVERFIDSHRRPMIRHIVELPAHTGAAISGAREPRRS